MPYQPRFVDGQTIGDADRACVDRYAAVGEFLRTELHDGRQIHTAVDIGAAEGYFAARLAFEFDLAVTAVDPNPELLKLHNPPSIDVLNFRVRPSWMASVRRHDVTLALSVLHHFKHWRAALDEILACREVAFIEVPHPDEKWMRSAKSRHELGPIHDTVASLRGATLLGTFPRTERYGARVWQRPLFAVSGRLAAMQGTVFGGSGSNGRNMRKHANQALTDLLGYVPYPGSLNLRFPAVADSWAWLGEPWGTWSRPQSRGVEAVYKIWRAWIDTDPVRPCHVMIPRTPHPHSLEVWAPDRLRADLGLIDGDGIPLDVETR